MSDIARVETTAAPAPAGHYAQAVVHAGIAYLAGQLPVGLDPAAPDAQSIEAQARQVLRNIDAVLAACGSDRARVLRATVYVVDIALWPRVNAVYAEFFGEHRPARTVVPVPALHHGFLIEMDVVAAVAEER